MGSPSPMRRTRATDGRSSRLRAQRLTIAIAVAIAHWEVGCFCLVLALASLKCGLTMVKFSCLVACEIEIVAALFAHLVRGHAGDA